MSITPRIQAASLIPRRLRGHESANQLRGRALPSEGTVLVGRGTRVHVRVSDPTISRRHARLDVVAGRCWLFDLGSANGTYVNGRRVAEATPLENGDVIRFGRVVFELSLVLESVPQSRLDQRRSSDLHEDVTVVTSRAEILRQVALASASAAASAAASGAEKGTAESVRNSKLKSAKILPGPHMRCKVLRVA
jgi:pSer/pThr/pTyr-binding forkhead associated (FHA) protein